MRLITIYLLLFIVSPNTWGQESFYLIKEKSLSVEQQLNSIFINYQWNSQHLKEEIIELNDKESWLEITKLRTLKKIIIPSPLGQRSCNFRYNPRGLVTYKYMLERKVQRDNSFSCEKGTKFKYYTLKSPNQPLSSRVYSIYLMPAWGEQGIMSKVRQLNYILAPKDFNRKTLFVLPELALAKGCNYIQKLTGEISPYKMITTKSEREIYTKAFRCIRKNSKSYPRHNIQVAAIANIYQAASNLSDVTVGLISAYAVALDYSYSIKENMLLSLETQTEFYTEVINRELLNNLMLNKTYSFEYQFKNNIGLRVGLFETWYFESLEGDSFEFTNSMLPYIGVTHSREFFKNLVLKSKFGYLIPSDLLGRDLIKSSLFLRSDIHTSLFGYTFVLGIGYKAQSFELSSDSNISLRAGLNFTF